MQRDEHSSELWTLLQHDEAEIPMHDILYDSCKYHMSFQPSEIPSTSQHGSDFAENSKADLFDENEFCVMDPCHKNVSYQKKKPWWRILFVRFLTLSLALYQDL